MDKPAPAKILAVQQVGKVMDHRQVLEDVSLDLDEGEIVGLVGPNGAGKTSLFSIISGGLKPSRGRVIYKGQDITGWGPNRICRAGLTRTFQIPQPFPEMTARQNVIMGLWFGKREAVPMAEVADMAQELLTVVGLGSKGERLGRDLTLSEQRRLEVARALATRPQVLLLDEIAAGLSPKAVDEAAALVLRLQARGLSLLVIDHFLTLTARVSHRLVALDRGRKIAAGPPQEVLNHPEVLAAYLGAREADDYEELSL